MKKGKRFQQKIFYIFFCAFIFLCMSKNVFSNANIQDDILKNKLDDKAISISEKVEQVTRLSKKHMDNGEYEESIRILEDFIKEHKGIKEEPRLLLAIGMEYGILGKKDQSAYYFTRIIIEYPNDKVAEYAEKELKLLKDDKFMTLLAEGRNFYSRIKKLPPYKGWIYIVGIIIKPNIKRFLIIFCLLVLIRQIFYTKLQNIGNGLKISIAWGFKNFMLILIAFLFIQPLLHILYLLPNYGVKGHFYAYNNYINHALFGVNIFFILNLFSGIVLIFIMLIFLKNRINSIRFLFFRNLNYFINIFLSMSFACVAYIFLKYTGAVLLKVFSYRGTIQQILLDFSIKRFSLIGLCYLLIINPFIEELLFRGIIFESFTRRLNILLALILSSLVFTICHLNFNLVPLLFLFVCGLIFAYLYKRLGLFSSFLAHSFYIIANHFI